MPERSDQLHILMKRFEKGISSFTQFAQPEELQEGLRQLALDLVSGEIHKVRKQFDDSEGDYIFLILDKA